MSEDFDETQGMQSLQAIADYVRTNPDHGYPSVMQTVGLAQGYHAAVQEFYPTEAPGLASTIRRYVPLVQAQPEDVRAGVASILVAQMVRQHLDVIRFGGESGVEVELSEEFLRRVEALFPGMRRFVMATHEGGNVPPDADRGGGAPRMSAADMADVVSTSRPMPRAASREHALLVLLMVGVLVIGDEL